MAHCKACNEEFEDRKDPTTGTYAELCHPCNSVSRTEVLLGHTLADEKPADIARGSYIESCMWRDELVKKDWGEGLGLLSPEDRVRHLEERATARFRQARACGMTFAAAVEDALGVSRFRGDQTSVQPGGPLEILE